MSRNVASAAAIVTMCARPMLFNSALYGAFLLGTFTVFWLLQARRLARAVFLVVASYGFYFYGTWDAAREQDVPFGPVGWSVLCLGVIFVGSSLDYWIARALAATESPHRRKALLLVSLVYYLGVLSVFKYWDFAADSLASLLALFGVRASVSHLHLVLPFGISFFTFETMSYTIDVYRRELKPARKYLDYLLFVAFFPHLVAGPIVRPRQMLPQLAAPPVLDPDMQARGLYRIATGLTKKIVIGDTLSINLVGRAFGNPERFSSVELVVAVYAYAIQIYCDFSGYTDVAIGSALLFGYELPENFRVPYLARDLQDFWRRGPARTYVNLMITMLLGGLWHGASWNFVIWGALHGAGLAATRMWQRARGEDRDPSLASQIASTFLTFQFVCFAWVFFRAPTFGHASLLLGRIARGTTGTANVSGVVALTLAAGFLMHLVPTRLDARAREAFTRLPAPVMGAVLALVAYGLHLAAGAKAQPFVYGQF